LRYFKDLLLLLIGRRPSAQCSGERQTLDEFVFMFVQRLLQREVSVATVQGIYTGPGTGPVRISSTDRMTTD
jgi:hypothetical protein